MSRAFFASFFFCSAWNRKGSALLFNFYPFDVILSFKFGFNPNPCYGLNIFFKTMTTIFAVPFLSFFVMRSTVFPDSKHIHTYIIHSHLKILIYFMEHFLFIFTFPGPHIWTMIDFRFGSAVNSIQPSPNGYKYIIQREQKERKLDTLPCWNVSKLVWAKKDRIRYSYKIPLPYIYIYFKWGCGSVPSVFSEARPTTTKKKMERRNSFGVSHFARKQSKFKWYWKKYGKHTSYRQESLFVHFAFRIFFSHLCSRQPAMLLAMLMAVVTPENMGLKTLFNKFDTVFKLYQSIGLEYEEKWEKMHISILYKYLPPFLRNIYIYFEKDGCVLCS